MTEHNQLPESFLSLGSPPSPEVGGLFVGSFVRYGSFVCVAERLRAYACTCDSKLQVIVLRLEDLGGCGGRCYGTVSAIISGDFIGAEDWLRWVAQRFCYPGVHLLMKLGRGFLHCKCPTCEDLREEFRFAELTSSSPLLRLGKLFDCAEEVGHDDHHVGKLSFCGHVAGSMVYLDWSRWL